MKKRGTIYKYCIAIVLFCAMTNTLFAQSEAHLDRTRIQTGDRIIYTITLPISQAGNVKPLETIPDSLEVISSAMDTANRAGKTFITFKYVLTSFIEGEHTISNIQGHSPLAFTVVPYPIDTTKVAIKDIHAQAQEPFSISEIMPILIWVGIALLAILLFLIGRKIYKKYHVSDIKKIFVKPKPKEPAHILALRKLDNLRLERLAEAGRVKEYYSSLSQILREYLYNRFSIHAIEMTSLEIISAMQKEKDINQESNLLMREILKNSDLAKFAKMIPDSFVCEKCMQDAVSFVQDTKIIVLTPQQQAEQKTNQKGEAQE